MYSKTYLTGMEKKMIRNIQSNIYDSKNEKKKVKTTNNTSPHMTVCNH